MAKLQGKRSKLRAREAKPTRGGSPGSGEVSVSKWAAGSPSRAAENGRGSKRSKPRRRWRPRALVALAVSPLAVLILWAAVHRIPWLGPLLADGLRAVVGVEAVSKLEDFAYSLQDRWNRHWRGDERPQAYWEVPTSRAVRPALPEPVEQGCAVPPFALDAVGPVHQSWSAPGDGKWVPIADAQHPDEGPRMLKTLLHPDKRRSWAAVMVVAIDLRQVDLHLVAGRHEPKNGTREAFAYERPAVIPAERHGDLLAAFNGGFKAEHGHYGMHIDGVTILPPRRRACFITMHEGQRIGIQDWDAHSSRAEGAQWWRQTPACMVEEGKLHPGLVSETNTYWGATVKGETIIRRSAIGLSGDRQVLFAAIGDHCSARAIAVAMRHAGAADVAQLDVNWSYPKFVLYEPRAAGSGELLAKPLTDGFEFSEDEYLRASSPRDFFYLVRKSPERIEARVCGPQGEPPAPGPPPQSDVAEPNPPPEPSQAKGPAVGLVDEA